MPTSTPRPPNFHVAVDVVLLSLRNDLPHIGVVQRRGADSYLDANYLARRQNPRLPRRVEVTPRDADQHWALPGGHVGHTLLGAKWGTGDTPDANLEQAALRVVARETGLALRTADLHQIGAFGDLDRDPRSGRTVSVAFLAVVGEDQQPTAHPDDNIGHVMRAQFRPIVDVLARPNRLEFDHEDIVLAAISLTRNLLVTTPLAAAFCRQEFTLGELRRVYEAFFHESLDSAERADQPEYAQVVRRYLARLEDIDQVSTPDLRRRFSELARMLPDEVRYEATPSDYLYRLAQINRLTRRPGNLPAPRPPQLLKKLDPTNFARKIQNLRILEPVDGVPRPTFDRFGKPAALWRLNPDRETAPFLLRLEAKTPSESSETR